jgi:excinuclease ABC subunit C
MLPDDPKATSTPTSICSTNEVEDESSLPAIGRARRRPRDRLASGVAAIQRYARLAPKAPGVYRMIDAKGEVLYVGKAKSIRKRIVSYAREAGHTARIMRMIAATATIEFVSTKTETEALLLEANLIKRLRPRFNVLLRDDKSFPYILITEGETPPMIVKHRGARSKPGDYYGPFASAQAVHRTITALERAFLIRSCTDTVYESRTRPCLLHQIKRCAAPCTGEISHERLRRAGARGEVLPLGQEPRRQGGTRRRDGARLGRARFRARRDLSRPARRAVGDPGAPGHQSARCRGCRRVRRASAGRLLVRRGVLLPHRAELGQPRLLSARRSLARAGEVLGAFLTQFYDDKPPPRCIFLSHEIEDRALLAEALCVKSGHKVEVSIPQRGEKKELVDHALANAREALGRKLAETQSQQNLLTALAATFACGKPRAASRSTITATFRAAMRSAP